MKQQIEHYCIKIARWPSFDAGVYLFVRQTPCGRDIQCLH